MFTLWAEWALNAEILIPLEWHRNSTNGSFFFQVRKQSGTAILQMTLFTANGLLVGDTRGRMSGIQRWLRGYVARAYQDWLYTQTGTFEDRILHGNNQHSWLCDVPELYVRRAPGNMRKTFFTE